MSEFDVFLCHNSQDKPEVKKIARQLQQEGLKPWLDEWELPPGSSWQELLEEQIEDIKTAAVFVGSSGFGPWQKREMRAFLSEFVDRGCPVIPVLLENAPQKPKLPIFLRAMTWVDFRRRESNPMKRLVWGVTGNKPSDINTPISETVTPEKSQAQSFTENLGNGIFTHEKSWYAYLMLRSFSSKIFVIIFFNQPFYFFIFRPHHKTATRNRDHL